MIQKTNLYLLIFLLLFACKNDGNENLKSDSMQERTVSIAPPFKMLEAEQTGLNFNNQLTLTEEFNIFNYMYFFNGSGVATADFNNDGLMDLYFGANQQRDALFLNKGNLQFEEATLGAGLLETTGWTTGVSVVDINNDGMMDIYVSRVSDFLELDKRGNQLLVCQKIENGIPIYQDMTKEYGLEFVGFATQTVFFDFDLDGDLDIIPTQSFTPQQWYIWKRESFVGKIHPKVWRQIPDK